MSFPGNQAYLLLEVPLEGPIEELQNTLEERTRVHASLGEPSRVELLRSSHAIARQCLERVLASAHARAVAEGIPFPVSSSIVTQGGEASGPLTPGGALPAEAVAGESDPDAPFHEPAGSGEPGAGSSACEGVTAPCTEEPPDSPPLDPEATAPGDTGV